MGNFYYDEAGNICLLVTTTSTTTLVDSKPANEVNELEALFALDDPRD